MINRKRSALTSDDLAWLEQRLSDTMVHVQPRQEFIERTKTAVMNGSLDEDESQLPGWLAPLSAMLLAVTLMLLAIALVRKRTASG